MFVGALSLFRRLGRAGLAVPSRRHHTVNQSSILGSFDTAVSHARKITLSLTLTLTLTQVPGYALEMKKDMDKEQAALPPHMRIEVMHKKQSEERYKFFMSSSSEPQNGTLSQSRSGTGLAHGPP